MKWRGLNLVVREVHASRGGRSGLRYEVALSSLSEELQSRYNADAGYDDQHAYAPPPGRIGAVAPNQSAEIERRYRVIQEAIDFPRSSTERAAEIERAARKWDVPVRTIHRWIADLDKSGDDINALGRKRPSDAGAKRVHVSRPFDARHRAAGMPEEQLAQLGEQVTHLIQRGWTSPAQRAGWRTVRREVVTALQIDLRERGIAIDVSAPDISQRRIMESQHYRAFDIRAHDRKRYDDMKPRIRRNNAALAPMAQIVMDVKRLDCIVRRSDGSTVWPKMIGFMDTGTHRLFRHFVLLAPGEGIRQEHVVEAFLAMVQHEEWGFPQQLYRDNGSEFFVMDMVRDGIALINERGARTIINAKPYSGASKPIESKFAVLDRMVFSQMRGWAGGNRMNKKTQTVGKPPAPFPNGFDAFVQEANERIEVFEHDAILSGPFKGKSPQVCFAEHKANGWRPVHVHPVALDAAFCKRDTRRVDRGGVRIEGAYWRHPELPNGQTVSIALPWRRGACPLVDIPGLGWAALIPDMQFLPGEIKGAIESGRMQQRADRATRQLGHYAKPLDLDRHHRERVVALPGRAAAAPLIDNLMSEQAATFVGARIGTVPPEDEALPMTDRERARAARAVITAALERQHGRG